MADIKWIKYCQADIHEYKAYIGDNLIGRFEVRFFSSNLYNPTGTYHIRVYSIFRKGYIGYTQEHNNFSEMQKEVENRYYAFLEKFNLQEK